MRSTPVARNVRTLKMWNVDWETIVQKVIIFIVLKRIMFDVQSPTGWNLFENLINLKLIMDFAGATQLQKETEKWAGILCIVLGKMTSAFNLVSVCFLVGSINEDEMDAHDTTHCIQFWAESIKSTPDERPTYGKMA